MWSPALRQDLSSTALLWTALEYDYYFACVVFENGFLVGLVFGGLRDLHASISVFHLQKGRAVVEVYVFIVHDDIQQYLALRVHCTWRYIVPHLTGATDAQVRYRPVHHP